MILFLSKYFLIFCYLFIASLIGFLFFFLSFFFIKQNSNYEKLSAFECGFDPFDDARNTFDIRFYLVAILFIIFDLEISFLFPWVLILGKLSLSIYWLMFLFLILLTIGFIVEWKKGALDWE